jgi:hypothetical protein
MEASAQATWDIGGSGEGSYEADLEVVETIRSVTDADAVVEVVMRPTKVEENGLPGPGYDERSFSLRLAPNGEVLEVLEVDGVPASALDTDELAFIGTYRPPLPDRRVRVGDSWEAEQALALEDVFQELVTVGRLERFVPGERDEVAGVSFKGQGPLRWTISLPEGEARLTGTASVTGTALIDMGEGLLRSARSSTSGEFEVTVQPSDGSEPIAGSMHLTLGLVVRRAAAG